MSDKEYHVVDVDLTDAEELKPDVHLEVAGVETRPAEPQQRGTAHRTRPGHPPGQKQADASSDEETMACVSTFLAYFQTLQPNFWNVLRKTKRPMAYLTATIKAWAEESGLDPKAFTSPTSGTTIARH